MDAPLTPTQARQALAGLRIAVSGGSWLAPSMTGKLFGLRVEDNPALPFVARLFGARDIAMGAALLDAGDEELARWLRIGIAVDAADVAAALIAGARRQMPKWGAALAATVAGTALWLGIVARDE